MDNKLKATINYLISEAPEVNPKKLQKLLYYVQSWHLALTAENVSEDFEQYLLFKADFEAWVHGPVIPEVYTCFKEFGGKVISKSPYFTDVEVDFNGDEIENINDVLEIYGKFNGSDLELLTHNELPWQEARKGLSPLESSNKKLSYKTIFEYYSTRLV